MARRVFGLGSMSLHDGGLPTTGRAGNDGGSAAPGGRGSLLRAGLLIAAFLGLVVSCGDDPPTIVDGVEDPPRAPGMLQARETSPSRIRLVWRDNSDNETGFRVERRIGSSAFAQVDTVPPNLPAYTDQDVSDGTTYAYRVVAYRFELDSPPSDTVSVLATDKEPPSVPAEPVPEDGTVDLDPTQALTLAWTGHDPQGAPLVYDVYFGPTLSEMTLRSPGQTNTAWDVTDALERNAHYYWRIVARDETGVSSISPIWGFNTVVDRDTIPGGYFVMGDTLQFLDSDSSRVNPLWNPGSPVETPMFELDRYLVTNQQFADFLNQMLNQRRLYMKDDEVFDVGREFLWMVMSPRDSDSDISFSVPDSAFVVATGRDKFPVVQVSWHGARAYAGFYGRTLPREADWEKAARGTADDLLGSIEVQVGAEIDTVGRGYPFPWGGWTGNADLNRGNFRNSGDPYESQGRVRTTPVGFFDGTVQQGFQTGSGVSPYGIHDMSGNVWQWCEDWYDVYRAPYSPPASGQFKVIRGGSFDKPYGSAVTWNRSYLAPETCDRAVGFRTSKQLLR